MKQHEIKVFKPNSKRADYTIRHPNPDMVAKKAQELLKAGDRVTHAFQSLKALGADSLSFHHEGRKIKVELPQAA